MQKFDIAISYAAEDVWIARDISGLLARYGITIYFSESLPDKASGNFRKELCEIYNSSQVNLALWTPSYSSKPRDSVVYMERQLLNTRHVQNQDFNSLLLVKLKSTKIPENFKDCLIHNLEDIGILRTVDFCVDRLIHTRSSVFNCEAKVFHPKGSEIQRGQILPCKIKISDNYANDSLKRWSTLGDIQVELVNQKNDTLKNYLIPSGAAPNFLSHSTLLRHKAECLKIKKEIGQKFVCANKDSVLDAVWFMIEHNGVSYPHIYCAEYDMALLNY